MSRADLCYARLQKELKEISRNPLPNISAAPSPNNILEWHYVLKGDIDSVYAGGFYHGTIVFPKEYPYKPPAIFMATPNGRFKTDCRLCLSISDFHPESWNPLWGISPILLGLQSFFYEDTVTHGALKGVPDSEKRSLAKASLEYNVRRSVAFRKIFPDYVKEFEDDPKRAKSFGDEDHKEKQEDQAVGLNELQQQATVGVLEKKVVAFIVVVFSILIVRMILKS